MPKVSIVMPVYNGETYLSEAIESILNQTLTDWEFIIVNEFGSNAKTTAILREYAAKDTRIKVIQNKTRLRIAESLNVGLRKACGKYIARMDADDISLPHRLEKQVTYMERHSEIDICGMNVEMFGENTWDWKIYDGPAYLKCSCLFYTPFIHPTIMMRASSLKRYALEYDASFFYTEDYEFFYRASRHLQYTNLKDREYRYRYLSTNATNVGGDEGLRLQALVTKRALSSYGLNFTDEEIHLLSPNTYPAAKDTWDALKNLDHLDLLLKEIFLCEAVQKEFGIDTVFQVLHRRWMDAYEKNRWNDCVMNDGQVERAINRGLFYHERFYQPGVAVAGKPPRISVVIPTYQSENYIMDTLYSILEQDEPDFEVLIVNEPVQNDRTVECVALFHDPRVGVIQNQKRMGLAESLNIGFRQAAGEYIARADSDDVYPKDRFSKQVAFLDTHPEIAICGTWQRHFGMRNYIHMPPVTPEEMKANLLFKCELCHSTVMLRRQVFLEQGLFYDSSYLSEDYELWCRASQKLRFATIPEVLGEYRWNGANITEKKIDRLDIEAQQIVARNLKAALGIEISQEDLILLSGWKNPFQSDRPGCAALQAREKALLDKIEKANNRVGAFDPAALKTVLDQRRVWAGILKKKEAAPLPVYQMEEPVTHRFGIKRRIKQFLKRLVKPFYRPFRHRYEDRLISIQKELWDYNGKLVDMLQTIQDSDGHLYDYYDKLKAALMQQEQAMTARIQQMDARIHQAEQLVNQTMDERIWKAEQLINQTMDERIWKAEQLINQIMDERVWKAEQLINQTMDERIWKAEQLINQTMDERVWKAEKVINYQLGLMKEFFTQSNRISGLQQKDKKVVVLGTPFHSNLGDQAQAACIVKWASENYPGYKIFEIDSPRDSNFDMYTLLSDLKSKMTLEDKLILHSGYHLTDFYMNELKPLLTALHLFPQKSMVIFPQSIYLQDPKVEEEVKRAFCGRSNVLFMAREPYSYKKALDLAKDAKVEFYPDIVNGLIGRYPVKAMSRSGILICKRENDMELDVDAAELKLVIERIEYQYGPCDWIDTTLDVTPEVIKHDRWRYIDEIVQKMAKYKVVITDRMHGLIFALVSNTPVIVLNAVGPKLASSLEIYQKVPVIRDYVFACSNLSELEVTVSNVLSKKYDYVLPDYFSKTYYDGLFNHIENEFGKQ